MSITVTQSLRLKGPKSKTDNHHIVSEVEIKDFQLSEPRPYSDIIKDVKGFHVIISKCIICDDIDFQNRNRLCSLHCHLQYLCAEKLEKLYRISRKQRKRGLRRVYFHNFLSSHLENVFPTQLHGIVLNYIYSIN
jgi:hypothetical protein